MMSVASASMRSLQSKSPDSTSTNCAVTRMRLPRAQKTRGQHGRDAHVAAGLARIYLHALILNDFRRRPHDERAHAREFRDHRISQREFVKT